MASVTKGLTISGVAVSGSTVAANCMAVVSYIATAGSGVPFVTVVFGPGQTITASYTAGSGTYGFSSGVVIISG